MLQLKPPSKIRRKELAKHPLKRKTISTDIEAHVDRGFDKKLKNVQRALTKRQRKAASAAQTQRARHPDESDLDPYSDDYDDDEDAVLLL